MTKRPTVREWHGLKPPVICAVKQLARRRKDTINQVYWLMKIRPQDNVIIESHPLKSWDIIADGRLIGFMDTGRWRQDIELNPDDYVGTEHKITRRKRCLTLPCSTCLTRSIKPAFSAIYPV